MPHRERRLLLGPYQSSRRPWPIVHARPRASSMWPRTRATTALHRMMSTVTASSALRILNLDRATATESPEKLKSKSPPSSRHRMLVALSRSRSAQPWPQ